MGHNNRLKEMESAMANATDEVTTTTDDTSTGTSETSTDAKGKAQSVDDAASSAVTDKADDQSSQENDSDSGDEIEDAGGSASDSEGDKSQSPKEQNRKAMELRLAQKNEKTQELRQKLQTDYIDEAADEHERQIREIQTDRYIEKVERVSRDLARDNEQAAREIDLFNPNSENFNKDLLDRSLKRYSRDCLTSDENGAIVAYSIPLLDYLREEADGYGYASPTKKPTQQEDDAAKKAKAEQDKAKMDAAADATGGTSAQAAEAKKSNSESFDDAFLAGMTDPYAPHKPRDAHTFSTAS